MPSVSKINKSPIAEYLRINKAIPKHDKYGCHFISPEGLYLGRMTSAVVNNYKVLSLDIFGEGMKKMFTKSVAYGQQYAYVKNTSSHIGLSIVPIKTFMRKVFVDFLESKNTIEDTEKTLANKLDLIAVDEETNIGLYDIDMPFRYQAKLTNYQSNKLKKPLFKFKEN